MAWKDHPFEDLTQRNSGTLETTGAQAAAEHLEQQVVSRWKTLHNPAPEHLEQQGGSYIGISNI